MTKVRNKRNGTPSDTLYIGRGSPWGNPFHIGRDGGRENVVDLYFQYLREMPALVARLDTLRGRDLLCYCAPLRCHGDILLLLANASPEDRAMFLEMEYSDLPLN